MKHNKKRNTAFLFEALVREMSNAAYNRNKERLKTVKDILKEFFSKGSVLHSELSLYEALYATEGLDAYTAEKLLHQVKQAHSKVSDKKVFEAQSKLIAKVNRLLSDSVYNNFVPNYRTLATISNIFNQSNPLKNRVLLEQEILTQLTKKEPTKDNLEHIDSLVFKKFTENFNKQYSSDLLDEQKALLNRYILSFNDDGADLMMFVSEEIGRIKTSLKKSMNIEEIQNDENMKKNLVEVIENLDSFKTKKIDNNLLEQLLQYQLLVHEMEQN